MSFFGQALLITAGRSGLRNGCSAQWSWPSGESGTFDVSASVTAVRRRLAKKSDGSSHEWLNHRHIRERIFPLITQGEPTRRGDSHHTARMPDKLGSFEWFIRRHAAARNDLADGNFRFSRSILLNLYVIYEQRWRTPFTRMLLIAD